MLKSCPRLLNDEQTRAVRESEGGREGGRHKTVQQFCCKLSLSLASTWCPVWATGTEMSLEGGMQMACLACKVFFTSACDHRTLENTARLLDRGMSFAMFMWR